MHSTNTSRTAHLLELMKKGDDAFNSRDATLKDSLTKARIYPMPLGDLSIVTRRGL